MSPLKLMESWIPDVFDQLHLDVMEMPGIYYKSNDFVNWPIDYVVVCNCRFYELFQRPTHKRYCILTLTVYTEIAC